MFSKATANFLRQIDTEGSLIHVSRLNDSQKLVPMALVVKRKRFWFWQMPKYQPSDFTLSHLLVGDTLLSATVTEKDFLTYKGTFGDTLSGKLDAKAGDNKVIMEGSGSSQLQSSFGKLRKQEVDVEKLLLASDDRLVDMQHTLVQQLAKRAEVLTVLKERVFTTSPCSITQKHKEQRTCGGKAILGVLGINPLEVCVTEGGREEESDVSLEIPSGTVIAYSLIELKIKQDGRYELCLQPSTIGGFEADSGNSTLSNDSFDTLCVVDGLEWSEEKVPEGVQLSALHSELQLLEMYLCPLAVLPQETRLALFQRFWEVLADRTILEVLENTLEDWCRGETCDNTQLSELLDGQKASASIILDLLQPDPTNSPDTPVHLTAFHLLVSAIQVLPDETLFLLSECCLETLEALDILIIRLRENIQPLPMKSLPLSLQEHKSFHWAEKILSSANVCLRKDTENVWVETGTKPGVLPLVLCVCVRGLSCLCAGRW